MYELIRGLILRQGRETLSLRPRQGLGAEGWPTRTISRPLGALAFDAAFHIEEADTRSYITGTTFYLRRSTSIGPRMKRDGGCNVLKGLNVLMRPRTISFVARIFTVCPVLPKGRMVSRRGPGLRGFCVVDGFSRILLLFSSELTEPR